MLGHNTRIPIYIDTDIHQILVLSARNRGSASSTEPSHHTTTMDGAVEFFSQLEPWQAALGATVAISLVPTMVLPLLPADMCSPGSRTLRVLLAFAAGGLLGDVFLHLIPHIMSPHLHDHDHNNGDGHSHHEGEKQMGSTDATTLGLYILLGFLIFFTAERVMRAIPRNNHGQTSSGKSSSKIKDGCSRHSHDGGLKIGGVLNLIADAMHNTCDGIAIGAACASGSPGLGLATSLSTLLHELPHEIGDYAVLRQNGMGKWAAIGAQLCTAFGAFAGVAIGVISGGNEYLEQVLLAATAGGFVYVACVTILPELLSSAGPGLLSVVAEISFMMAGIGIMVAVANLEHSQADVHVHHEVMHEAMHEEM
jgi:zinc transporter 7